MSYWGDRGNGFDFLIDPFGHGGMRRSVTTVPYPVVVHEVMDSRTEPAFDIELLGVTEEVNSTSVALSGTMRDTLLVYTYGDEIDSFTASALSGTLQAILRVYTYGPDEIDSLGARALSGTLRRILIVIQMPPDDIDGITAVALGGTLQ